MGKDGKPDAPGKMGGGGILSGGAAHKGGGGILRNRMPCTGTGSVSDGRDRQTERKLSFGKLHPQDLAAGAGIAFGISAGVAFLLYDSPWGMFSFPAVLPVVLWMLGRKREQRRLARLNQEFKDYMYAVGGALAAGYSVERAFLNSIRDVRQLYGEQSVLAAALSGMDKRLGVKEPLERILEDFAAASGSEDIENFVEVFCYAKRGGGDFVHIIQTTAGRICDKIEVLDEIHTVMAEKAMEQKIMCLVPMGILGFFRLTSPEFIGILYGNPLGVCIMTAALGLYGLAFLLGVKIVGIEV